MKPFIHNDWWPVLEPEFEKPIIKNYGASWWRSINITGLIQTCITFLPRSSGRHLAR